MRRIANVEKSKCSINNKTVKKFQDESHIMRNCLLIIFIHHFFILFLK